MVSFHQTQLAWANNFLSLFSTHRYHYGASDANDIRYKYHVDITKPDGTTERLPSSGSLVSDSTGTTYTQILTDYK